jgi:hypothetical protein
MKSVCPFCNSSALIRWGKRRRKCGSCGHTFRVTKAGRKRKLITEMYLLDRSTFRRIGSKIKRTHVETIRKLRVELKYLSTPLSLLKKILIVVATPWWSMANISPLRVSSIASI